nr:vegetative incompatibility protein het-e-1 [Colletotrichum truncatum]KAF6786913.1 vegetative incompatibility protein het-e-1 [Colletotrichum truncatum]
MDIDDVQWWLQELHAVLDNPSDEKMPLRLLHKSFSDFLIGQEGPGANRYGIDPGNIHAMLTLRCIQRMRLGLRRDICGIKSTGKAKDEIDERVIESRIPADLKYACCYWIHHLQHSGPMDNAVSIFLTEHFLHWIEALSLLGRLSDGGIAIKRLLKTLQSVPDTSLELIDLVKDTSRFISTFGPIIGRVPLQVYAASLLFSPISSKVRLRYWHEQLPRIAGIHGVKEDWDMNQQTLEGHNDWVRDVTFSPDSQLIASASYDGTVRLWDSTTSGHRGTLKGHGYPVKGVAFSPDGKLIATASYDSTVKLWDMNGVCRHTLEGHTSSVNAVVFSPDSQLVLSASGDKTVHIWSTNGIHQKTIEGHDKAVTAIAVSPDGKLIASGSIDKTVRLWDMEGNHRHTFEGYPAPVSSVAFSPDGTLLASGSGDRMVRLCELDGTNLRRLEGHGGSANTVKFSPDGSLLASGSTDRCIRLWDVASGFHVSTIQGHTDSINSVAFSPDGQLLASAANDGSVRVWYMYRDTYQPTVEGHNDKINVLTLSADRKLLVSASEDGTVRLGDALDNTHLQMFTGHQGPVLTVALSPDGLFLATSSADYTLNVWDITRGEFLYSLRVGNWMRAIAFSPDNKLLASGSDDGIFQIWDIMTGAAHSYFKDEEYVVRAISFSNDTRLLVSAAEEMGERPEERVLRIWDTKTGAPTWTIQSGKQSSIGAVAFSNDDRLVAAASETEIRLWDVTERVQYATLNIGSVRSLVFDPKIETRLHTDLGTFDFFKPVQLDMVPYSESLEYNAAFGGLRLSSDRTWIMKGGEKIIWLPPDYRPTASAVRESTIYIGCASGRIVWFEDGELY